MIVPKAGLVAVRQIDVGNDLESPGEGYDDFIARVLALAEASGRLASPPTYRHALNASAGEMTPRSGATPPKRGYNQHSNDRLERLRCVFCAGSFPFCWPQA